MNAADLILCAVVATGLIASSIGIQAVISVRETAIRAQGALCIALGIACVVVGNLPVPT